MIERIRELLENTVVEAIDAHGDRVATRLADAAEFARSAVGAFGAHADDVVGRVKREQRARGRGDQGTWRSDHGVELADASLALSGRLWRPWPDNLVGRIGATNAEVLEAIRTHGNSVAVRLSEAAASASNAVAAHADDVVNRVSASSAEAAETLRTHGDILATRLSEAAETVNAHGDAVAAQLGAASAMMSGAVGAYADEVIGRVSASGAQTVDAIRFHRRLGRRPTRRCLGGDARRCRRARG